MSDDDIDKEELVLELLRERGITGDSVFFIISDDDDSYEVILDETYTIMKKWPVKEPKP